MNNKSTSYEVYVLQRGRWELHARHPAAGREAAIEEAKTLETLPNVVAVRVTREVYDAQTGVSSEYTIFRRPQSSDDVKGGQPIAPPRAKAENEQVRAASAKRNPPISHRQNIRRPRPPARSIANQNMPARSGQRTEMVPEITSTTVAKLIAIAVASVIVATIVTWVTKLAFDELESLRTWLGRDHNEDILFGVFLLSFLLGVGASTFAFIPRDEIWGRRTVVSRTRATGSQTAQTSAEDAAREHVAALISERRTSAAAATDQTADAAETDSSPEVAETHQQATGDSLPEDHPPEEHADDSETPNASALSMHGEKYKLALLNFLHQGLEATKTERPNLDSFSKFGIY